MEFIDVSVMARAHKSAVMKGRIALFTNTLAGGGMERAVVNIANQLSQNLSLIHI